MHARLLKSFLPTHGEPTRERALDLPGFVSGLNVARIRYGATQQNNSGWDRDVLTLNDADQIDIL